MGVLVAPVEARRDGAWTRARLAQRLANYENGRASGVALISAATMLAIGIEGYHPYAEDGGIYLAGVKRLLDVSLYPHDAAFAMEPTRWSLFAPMVAALARISHVPLPWVLFALYVGSIWATLFAARVLAARCFARLEAQAGAVMLLACWLGLPVAGTALYVMDPYLTARSFATPAMLMAIVGALDATGKNWDGDSARRRRAWAMWAGGLGICAAMHPLTAMYAGFATSLLGCLRSRHGEVRIGGTAAVCATAIAAAAGAQMLAPAESFAYVRAALTRSYWFLGEWRWYEFAGLVAPAAILGGVAWARGKWMERGLKADCVDPVRALAQTAVVAGALACLVALLFARENSGTHFVARMQPLRVFQIVYAALIVTLGGWMGERVLRRSVLRWSVAVVLLGSVMFGAARSEYSHSDHLEAPWTRSKNAWLQAFEWTRDNTPKNELFAMDADYIHAATEDAQNFRAIAERGALPDLSKDGGEASIAPDLAEAWAQGVTAQEGLNAASDEDRREKLRPLGVTWVVLDAAARTELACPYANASVRVCRLD